MPWEGAFESKSERYKGLVQDCRDKGWETWLYPVEVGCRGFPAQSAWKLMTEVGLRGTERKKAVRRPGRQQREPLVGFGAGGRS